MAHRDRPNALFDDRRHRSRDGRDMRTSDKENRVQSIVVGRHRPTRPKREDFASDLPTTSTQICSLESSIFEQKMRERELFSTSSSSWSDDERSSLSRKKPRARLITYHSTSDLTTSDSSIGALREMYMSMDSREDDRLLASHPSAYTSSEITHDMSDSDDSDEEDDGGPMDERALQGMPRLESIEESPVLPAPSSVHDDCDLPPQIPPLPFDTPIRFPVTNCRQTAALPTANHRRLTTVDQPTSLFVDRQPARPEQFYLPSQIAKLYEVNGILFLTITITKHRDYYILDLVVQYAHYFLSEHPQISSYVKAVIRPNERLRKRACGRRELYSFESPLVHRSHQPNFNCDFQFPITSDNFHARDKLTLSVYTHTNGANSCNLLGRMTFSLRRLRAKARDRYHDAPQGAKMKVCDGGYFLLPEKTGDFLNWPQDKIEHTKYYDHVWTTPLNSESAKVNEDLK